VQPPASPTSSSPLQDSLHSQSSSQSGGQAQDDFVMVDFKPAFSKDDLLPMDLGTFYREFQNPPQLTSLSIDVSAQSMAEDLETLPEKLAIYEQNIDEFDKFVDTLQ
ncbi:autophagy-related protein 13 isoform X1, partial [Tachysurus ichikawai]